MRFAYAKQVVDAHPLLAQAAEAIPGSRWECDPELYAERGIRLLDALGRPIAYADALAWSVLAGPGANEAIAGETYTRGTGESYDDCARAVLKMAQDLTREMPRATV